MSATPPGGRHSRRVRSGISRRRARAGNGGLPGDHPGLEGLPAADRRRLRRELLLGRRRATPQRRRHPGVRVVLLLLAMLSSLGLAGVATVFAGYNIYLSQVPDSTAVASLEPPLDTNVYASDGTLIDIIHPPGYYHLHATYDQISRYVIEATVDIEDRHFWTESSLDVARIVQAGWGYVRHVPSGGASTITEQLAKISFLQDNGSLSYKIKEIILGSEIFDNFSKQQILEMYLNRIPYGEQSIGVATAAEIYFHEPASQLDLAQSAMLAGLPEAPTEYNPLNHGPDESVNPAAKQRQRVVLNAMVNNGDITAAQANAAYAENLTFYTYQDYDPYYTMGSARPVSFLQYLVNYYLPQNFGDSFEDPGGWDVYTTINLADQKLADQTVHNVVTANPGWFVKRDGDGALVSMDPKTGAILAMTGSANYNDPNFGQDDMAIETRQPGSTMKLFTYSALIASRQYTVLTPISDQPMNLNGWTPKDYEGATAGFGYCTMELCLGNSLNLPAVRAEYAIGVVPIANLAVASGLSLYDGGQPAFPTSTLYSFTLGTEQVSPLDLGDAAATIADLGVEHPPAPVTKITDDTSQTVIYQYDANAVARRVLPENVAFVMDETLSNNSFRQPEFGTNDKLTLPDRPVSAKTGTSGAGYANYDNWTIGWTPDLLTIVWVGDPRGEGPAFGLTPGVTSGLTGAAPIWQTYMEGVTKGTPVDWYKTPSDVYEAGGSWFLPGTGPVSAMGVGSPICDPDCVPMTPPSPTPSPGASPAPTLSPGPTAGPSPPILP
ncbi:MAG TPA: transglycosylase domain-containing protein [Candidatus Binatia bacterium]|nr:transglycosylase domain-containing protein [Candidatus Binatia bacterium]